MIAVRAIFQTAFSGWPVLYVAGELLWWECLLCYLLAVQIIDVV